MKCQNCGKNEVNFHYSSNINGTVTERHLCSECAAGMRGELEPLTGFGDVFGFMPLFSGMRTGFMPTFGFNMPFPFVAAPQLGILLQTGNPGPAVIGTQKPEADVDDEMKKRREVNIIREQMRAAAENEDFEKAAELRDKIREMEK